MPVTIKLRQVKTWQIGGGYYCINRFGETRITAVVCGKAARLAILELYDRHVTVTLVTIFFDANARDFCKQIGAVAPIPAPAKAD